MNKTKPIILAVDDEQDMLKTYQNILKKKYQLLTALSGQEALVKIENENIDLVLLDIRMPKLDGIKVLKKIKELDKNLEVIMITASREVTPAVEAIKLGALDYISKPFDVEELLATIDKALEKTALVKENLYLKTALQEATSYCDLIGQTPQMKSIFQTIEKVAPSDSRVLITGESGTGKELVARAIHQKSNRKDKPFIAVNCAAMPENLLESELFGYERGAFTGAHERKLGKFELANGGTILLDEIGCMPASMQAKILRVIQESKIDRVGGTKPVKIDLRILAATNIKFQQAIEDGSFRQDLYYRLNVIPIQLPALRERKKDIGLFLNYFLNQFNKQINKQIEGFSSEALALLKSYHWPGNVRELQNIVERLVTLAPGKTIDAEAVKLAINFNHGGKSLEKTKQGLAEAMTNFERDYIKKVLAETNGNRSQAAKKLKLARSTLISKLHTLGLS